MTDLINIICVLVHLLTLIVIWKVWGFRSFIHPGFYFAFLWIVSVTSQWYLIKINYASLPHPEYIDELNIYAAYTSICFSIFSLWKFHKTRKILLDVDIVRDVNRYRVLTYIVLICVIIMFISLGASFSFAYNRMEQTEGLKHIGRNFSFLYSISSIMVSTLIFLTISAGIFLSRIITKQVSKTNNKWILLMPLFATFIYALAIGGRNPIIGTLKNYFLGIGIGIPIMISSKIKKKILSIIFSSVILFALFSTFIQEGRANIKQQSTKTYDSKFVENFSGIMEYMSAHYWGYQLRRIDFATGEDLMYGVATFYDIGSISIPFSSQLGINGDLWTLFGVKYDPLGIYKSGSEGSYTTSTIYSLLIKDFGIVGTYIAIILLVAITQIVFLNLMNKPKKTAISLIFHILFFTYWASSNFNSGFMNIQGLIIGAVIFDLVLRNYDRKIIKNR